ncbi:tRNA pseudouridine(38-40) synthase TruA [Costertonia aggregata]|uniref:tRNA pseudouridine synthase A n=1 Tax=Costertonia aggregata TaxID=343403 RepID=A0A7H9ARY5_9FLAO|nr:tRNA pseudouridine(38-40) synthase TruA [Costertonia aggregata]QLG46199.1 tRNA pseudouridine(38-40) synthase TruA [Costertonia aggregata]
MRYFIQFSYYGKAYHGWQNQPNAITVQEVLEKAMSALLREKIALVGAGRTDAGVHAKEMFAHFDNGNVDDISNFVYRLNAFLPNDIAVKDIVKVNSGSHARFDAEERTYEYWVVQKKNPFYTDSAYYIKADLNVESMNQAASLLLGRKDFECFSKSNTDVRTYLCDVKKAIFTSDEEKLVFTITADRFLRNMVRAIVGTLLEVGVGKCRLEDVKTILKSKDRGKAGPSVPAKGLYLTNILYPKSIYT